MSLTEAGDSVIIKYRVCDRFRNILENLRSKREITIIQLINVCNKSLFLSICKLLSSIRDNILNCSCFATKAFRKRCTFNIPAPGCDSKIRTTLRF
jgi:hypothetical protein